MSLFTTSCSHAISECCKNNGIINQSHSQLMDATDERVRLLLVLEKLCITTLARFSPPARDVQSNAN